MSRPGVAVANVKMVFNASSFEYLCCRITTKGASTILATVYMPGSADPSVTFFKEFASPLKILSTFDLPVIITGDHNVHLERSSDDDAVKYNAIIFSFGLVQHVSSSTHNLGGLLDVIVTGDANSPSDISIYH